MTYTLFIEVSQPNYYSDSGVMCWQYKSFYVMEDLWSMLLMSHFLLCQGDLHDYLDRKGRLDAVTAVKFALDIAKYAICQMC